MWQENRDLFYRNSAGDVIGHWHTFKNGNISVPTLWPTCDLAWCVTCGKYCAGGRSARGGRWWLIPGCWMLKEFFCRKCEATRRLLDECERGIREIKRERRKDFSMTAQVANRT